MTSEELWLIFWFGGFLPGFAVSWLLGFPSWFAVFLVQISFLTLKLLGFLASSPWLGFRASSRWLSGFVASRIPSFLASWLLGCLHRLPNFRASGLRILVTF